MSAYHIRTMHWWDLDDVLTIEQEVFPTTAWSAETFWSELAGVPEARWYAVARDEEDTVVGYVGLQVTGAEADIQTLARSPHHQGRGIGARLLDAAVKEATRRGSNQLFLEVAAANTPAIQLYEQTEFRVTAQRRDYYGKGADALVMRRRLSSSEPES